MSAQGLALVVVAVRMGVAPMSAERRARWLRMVMATIECVMAFDAPLRTEGADHDD